MAKKIKSYNWKELPIEDWNSRTFQAYLMYLTEEKFGVSYEPRGAGTKQQRWSREMGMINNARKKYGNDVLKQFIRIAVEKYKPNKQYPYMAFAFAWTYMSELVPVAQKQVADAKRREEARAEAKAEAEDIDEEFF